MQEISRSQAGLRKNCRLYSVDCGRSPAAAVIGSQTRPECCDDEGMWWDLIAVYAPGEVWEHGIPSAAYLNEPVIRVSGKASDVIGNVAGRRAGRERPHSEQVVKVFVRR